MSDLLKWFERRRESRTLSTIQQHLVLTTGIVEYLEKAVLASLASNEQAMQNAIEKVIFSERDADRLRRKVMDEIAKGDLSSIDREDLLHLVKRIDMVADWNREATRILNAIQMEYVPASIQKGLIEIIKSVKGCVLSLQICINKMMTKSEEALQAADAVEREEEKVDDEYERIRILFGRTDWAKAGVAVLISQLLEAIEMIADLCEDACDQVRVIMVRNQ